MEIIRRILKGGASLERDISALMRFADRARTLRREISRSEVESELPAGATQPDIIDPEDEKTIL